MKLSTATQLLAVCPLLVAAQVTNFPYESTQLQWRDTLGNPFLRFGNTSQPIDPDSQPLCRAWPGSQDWPTQNEWRQFNVSLGGALLRPEPPAYACHEGARYDVAQCSWLVREAGRTSFWIDNPLAILTPWPQGNTCSASLNSTGPCTRGGFPEYVVRASSVKQVQAAVNFARNKNVRLVIKNTGHDFGGRSTGAGSLSIWTHNLNALEFVPDFESPGYSGMAVLVGAGVQAWELRDFASRNKVTVLHPGGSTVGVAGGWFASGGHGPLTSKLGLGSDQILSINVVTADGQFVTADPETNHDLFWALRGGGPGNYGVVTSVVMRAFPPIRSTSISVAFSVNPNATQPAPRRGPFQGGVPNPNATAPITAPFPNATRTFPLPSNTTATPRDGTLPLPGSRNPMLTDVQTFWRGVKLTYRYCTKIEAVGGYCYSYIYPLGNSSFRFTHSFSIPDLSAANASTLLAPLYNSLRIAGINITQPRTPTQRGGPSPSLFRPPFPTPTGGISPSRPPLPTRESGAASLSSTRYRSRLIPHSFFDSDPLYDALFSAIITGVSEGGYTFHGIAYTPTETIAGPIGADSAVNPAWRRAALHASFMENIPEGMGTIEARLRDARGKRYADAMSLKGVEGGGSVGSYLNEGDVMETDWKGSFYGVEKYGRLLRVKAVRDPWGVFWAPTTPGSEEWEVKTLDGYPGSQNGRLCRAGRGI
ncbi:hypothetical protein B0T16DRAFT_457225 [Cercophora newfieldiana]|uniref:FAD-binding PCMH-type domain-containing protein n=1 Tax=Cercophora newfieldiana TaxID=92897 RepID=A0AA39YCM4_9PEZI|nr:hypothetical protein B0T16DRAFT_457225 [Cercophora newfieldiana]